MVPPIRGTNREPPTNRNPNRPPTSTCTLPSPWDRHPLGSTSDAANRQTRTQPQTRDRNEDVDMESISSPEWVTDSDYIPDPDWLTTESETEFDDDGDIDIGIHDRFGHRNPNLDVDVQDDYVDVGQEEDVGLDLSIGSPTQSAEPPIDIKDAANILMCLRTVPRVAGTSLNPGSCSGVGAGSSYALTRRHYTHPHPHFDHERELERERELEERIQYERNSRRAAYMRAMAGAGASTRAENQSALRDKGKGKGKESNRERDTEQRSTTLCSAQAQSPRNRERYHPYSTPAAASTLGSASALPSVPLHAPIVPPAATSAYAAASRGRSSAARPTRRRPSTLQTGPRDPDCDSEMDSDEAEIRQPPRYGALTSCGGAIRCRPRSRSRSLSRSPLTLTSRNRQAAASHDRNQRHTTTSISGGKNTSNNNRPPATRVPRTPSPRPRPRPESPPTRRARTRREAQLTPSTETEPQFQSESESESVSESEFEGESTREVCGFQSCNAHQTGEKLYLRKIISHVFGRNKNETKSLPDSMFVRYCRKHYQRARYRSEAEGYNNNNNGSGSNSGNRAGCGGAAAVNNRGKNWTDRQCELVMDALNRMRKWGEVQGFRVGLRKREVQRIKSISGLASTSAPSASASGSGKSQAQVPANNAPSTPSPGAASNTTSISTTTTSRTSNSRQTGRQQRPSVAAPVPQWLTQWIIVHEGQVLSFDEIIELVEDIQRFIPTVVLRPGQELRFPDIEIIPVYFESRTNTPSGSGTGSGSGSAGRGRGQGHCGRGNGQSPTPESGSRSRTGAGSSHPRRPHSGAFSGFPKNRDRKG